MSFYLNMRKLLAVKVQSCTDLITNSSSELFQLRTDDTVEQVSETLSRITSGYCPPVLFRYQDYLKCRNKYKELVERPKYNGQSDEEWDEICKNAWEKEQALQEQYPDLFIYDVVNEWFFDKEDPEHVQDAYRNYLCADRLFGRKTMDNLQKEFQIFVLQNNYVDEEERRYPLTSYRVAEEAFTKFMETHEMPPLDEVKEWSNYSYGDVEELDGCILVLSEEDNSIPYDTWDSIYEIYEGRNYHLG